jgi:hypothetical protein
VAQRQAALLKVTQQPPWGGHQHIHTTSKQLSLKQQQTAAAAADFSAPHDNI